MVHLDLQVQRDLQDLQGQRGSRVKFPPAPHTLLLHRAPWVLLAPWVSLEVLDHAENLASQDIPVKKGTQGPWDPLAQRGQWVQLDPQDRKACRGRGEWKDLKVTPVLLVTLDPQDPPNHLAQGSCW